MTEYRSFAQRTLEAKQGNDDPARNVGGASLVTVAAALVLILSAFDSGTMATVAHWLVGVMSAFGRR